MSLSIRFLLQVMLLLSLASIVAAQSRAPLPTLTTDDVIGAKPSTPTPLATTKDASAKPEEKPSIKDAVAITTVSAEEDLKEKAEKDWNERLKKAQETSSELERRADQTELQMTQLRNQLFSATSRGPEMNGQLNARIGELTDVRNRLRAESQIARQAVDTLQAEGRSKAYKASETALINEKGEPDAKAYQAERERLQNELRDAQARIEVLQIRLNSIQAEVLKKGNGDNFTLNRLRQERDRTTAELSETRTKIEDLNSKLQGLRQKASASGITLGAQ